VHDHDERGARALGQLGKRSKNAPNVMVAMGVDRVADERDERIQHHHDRAELLDPATYPIHVVGQRDRVDYRVDEMQVCACGLQAWADHRGQVVLGRHDQDVLAIPGDARREVVQDRGLADLRRSGEHRHHPPRDAVFPQPFDLDRMHVLDPDCAAGHRRLPLLEDVAERVLGVHQSPPSSS
jgi:hypothetical protein